MSVENAVLIDVRLVSEMLARSERAIYDDIASGKMIPPTKLGSSNRWKKSEILDWIDAGCPAAANWIEMKAKKSLTSNN